MAEPLIARLEAAGGARFELDREIWKAVTPERYHELLPPAYTASIDAALTLVPRGWNFHIWSVDDGLPSAELTGPDGRKVFGLVQGKVAPALAVCVAALKARGEAP